jgi:hypothetical protein
MLLIKVVLPTPLLPIKRQTSPKSKEALTSEMRGFDNRLLYFLFLKTYFLLPQIHEF